MIATRHAPVRRRQAIAAAIALACGLQGCTSWEPRTAPVPETLAAVRPSTRHPVQLTLRDGRTLTLTALAVAADSVVGLRADAPRGTPARVALPIDEVRSVATRESAPGRTRTLLGGILLGGAALGVAFLLALASSST